jgi:enediyne biosynthesis protein E4
MRRFASLLLLVPALAACSDPDLAGPTTAAAGSGSGGAGGSGGADSTPAVACDAHATTGPTGYVDRSDAWGLTAAGVTGLLLSAADLDGDGYPDLITHTWRPNTREVIGGEERLYRVLMNEPAEGGGRTFVDRTAESGYGKPVDGSTTEYRVAQMAIYGDVDNDGDLDVFSGVYTDGNAVQDPPTPADLDRSEILLNDGKGHFTLGPRSAVQTPGATPLAGASFVDFDRDGALDVFVGNWYGKVGASYQQLLRGDKAAPGAFFDVSTESGIKQSVNRRPVFGTTACDVNADGAPELLASAYGRAPNLLYQNDGASLFTDVGVASGFAYDDNQTYDDNQFFLCHCAADPTDPACDGAGSPQVQCPSAAQLAQYWNASSDDIDQLGGNTFTTVCSDIDGDGALDLYNAEIVHWWAGSGSDPSELLVNVSDASSIRFERPGNEVTGMAWPHPGVDWNEGGLYAAAADLDNDGREDVLVGASDYDDQYGLVFHQKPDGTFEETGRASGFDHACASAPIVADFDRDGDLDIVVGSSRMRDWCAAAHDTEEVHLFESDASTSGHWLAVKLSGDGATTNRTGIGARVVVRTVGADGVEVRQTKELSGGYGHYGLQNDTVLFFGIGACAIVHSVEVTWPDLARTTQRFDDVTADRVIELRQGDAAVYEGMPAP